MTVVVHNRVFRYVERSEQRRKSDTEDRREQGWERDVESKLDERERKRVARPPPSRNKSGFDCNVPLSRRRLPISNERLRTSTPRTCVQKNADGAGSRRGDGGDVQRTTRECTRALTEYSV